MTACAPTIAQVISILTDRAPLHLQESYDNSGLQVGRTDIVCRGITVCVDPTPEVVADAAAHGCNLVLSHHPLLFSGLKSITGATPVEQAVIEAIRRDITIYSLHTPIDSAPGGISMTMGAMLGLEQMQVLEPKDVTVGGSPTGLGAVGILPRPMLPAEFIDLVKRTFHSPITRCTRYPADEPLKRVALCGGSGSSLIELAIRSGAQAYVTSDTSYHRFVDYADRILIVDIGHYESESCVKAIFIHAIREIFPNFAVRSAQVETNPIIYM